MYYFTNHYYLRTSKQQLGFVNFKKQKIPFFCIINFLIFKKRFSTKVSIRFGLGKNFFLHAPISSKRYFEIYNYGLFKY